jgi:hypothetical protein
MELTFCDVCGKEVKIRKTDDKGNDYYEQSFEFAWDRAGIIYKDLCIQCYEIVNEFFVDMMNEIRKEFEKKFPIKKPSEKL